MENSDKIVKKIMEDLRIGEARALIVKQRMGLLRPELQPCVAAWKNSKVLDFSYADITICEIMEKEHASYLEAIFKMNVLMENPAMAAKYKQFTFIRR